MDCKKFCAGAVNSHAGIAAVLKDKEIIVASKSPVTCLTPVRRISDNRYTCPMGCIHLCTDKHKHESLLLNGTPEHAICTRGYTV